MSGKMLGLFVHAGQSAAAVVVDGRVVAAAAEERFNRVKQSRAFPHSAMRFCLAASGMDSLRDVDGIAVPWNPAVNMESINLSGFTQWRRYDPEWMYILPNQLLSSGLCRPSGDFLKIDMSGDGKAPLYFVDHHLAHMASAVCQAPFSKGLYVIADEYGEYNSVRVGTFDGSRHSTVKTIPYPHSLGVFYAAMTEYLAFRPNSDEWKVMGACAYGNHSRFSCKLEQVFQWDDDAGEWVLDQRYVEHANMKRAGYLNDRLARLVGIPPRNPRQPLTQDHYDLAAAVQHVAEKRIFQLVDRYLGETGETSLVLAGGCFMNSLANGKILGNTSAKRLFVPYAAADNGGAMGAPLFVDRFVLGNVRDNPLPPIPYLGPEFSERQIEDVLKKFKLKYRRLGNVSAEVAKILADGKLVGWFQGRMEYGERALGNRSILADPRRPEMKDSINSAVKYREAFRPFAPSVLEEFASEYFEIPDGVRVPYMEQVYPIRPEKRPQVPAVVHNDGTGRLQTVTREMNPLYYGLIDEFRKATGVPILLNTSFNVQGEPIVCTPEDAIRCFFSCGLDVLVLGAFILEK